jgi:pSer/pThr/pTyr-binding forkhead associated (FHA) protein
VQAARYRLRGPGVDVELVNAVNLIGRSRRCDVVLTDPNVSRQHAELRLAGGQVVLRDLGSTNGTRVNRRAVTQVVLQPGDRLEVGTTELLFERLA